MRRVLIALALVAVFAAPGSASANGCSLRIAQGTLGTADDPIRIGTVADLTALATSGACYASSYAFRQTADIDLAGAHWVPVGLGGPTGFNGTYDGDGHAVADFVITDADSGSYKGLFGRVNGGTIRNLTVRGATITGSLAYYGAAVGDVDDGLVEDVRVENASVASSGAGQYAIGGAIGGADASTIRRVTVSGATVTVAEATTYDVGGAIGQTYNSTLSGITATGIRVDSAGSRVGGGFGAVTSSSVAGATAAGAVSGAAAVGGLVGTTACAQVQSASASVTVTASTFQAGGLIGAADGYCPVSAGPNADATITDSSASGAVTAGTISAGGLIGKASGVVLARDNATGRVTAPANAGGLVGTFETSTASDVYALGDVSAPTLAGGLIGGYRYDVTLARAYAAGAVTGTTSPGGLIGGESVACGSVDITICSPAPAVMSVTASFWDTTASGQVTSDGGTAKTTAQLRDLATFTAAGWSAASGWSEPATTTWGQCFNINGGRPFLNGQYTATTNGCWSAPSAPQAPKATAGDGQVTVTWSPPASDGGSPVTGYVATATMQPRTKAGAVPTCSVSATRRRCTIKGLRNGRTYRVAVRADSEVGAGTAATVVVRPRRALVILSTRRSGLTIVTRARVTVAGSLTQVATPTQAKGAVCRASATPAKAGVVTLRCALDAATVRTLASAPVRLRVATRFAPARASAVTTTRIVRFDRTAVPSSVTG